MARECTLSEREAHHAMTRLAILTPQSGAPVSVLDSPDALHDARVASRRARVFLAEFEDNLPGGVARKARKRLQKIGRRLGDARELDVSLKLLRDWPADDEAVRDFCVARLEADRTEAQGRVADTEAELASGAMTELFSRMKDGFEPSTACHLRHARARLRKRLTKVENLYNAWWTSRLDEDLHLVRIRLKTFRYAVEIYRRLYGRPADKFLHELEAAQDSLGRWNDRRSLRGRVQATLAAAPKQLRAGVTSLAAAIAAEADAAQENVREELGAFFEKQPMKEYHELFGDWSRKCCRGAR